MTMTIGVWIIPVLVTVAAFVWASWPREDESLDGGMFSGTGRALGLALRGLVAISLSLAAWLVWSLMT